MVSKAIVGAVLTLSKVYIKSGEVGCRGIAAHPYFHATFDRFVGHPLLERKLA